MSRRALLLLLAAAALAVGHLALDPGGFRKTLRLRADCESLESANAELRRGNERLRREVKALADDPAELERAAREELGLIRPGEVVFRLEDGDGAGSP
jgi:cell division protein FtsB